MGYEIGGFRNLKLYNCKIPSDGHSHLA